MPPPKSSLKGQPKFGSRVRTQPQGAKKQNKPHRSNRDPEQIPQLPLTLQQTILKTFQHAPLSVSPLLQTGDEEFKTLLQDVKGYLYRREFDAAFKGREEFREVYALRWSPARAVAYAAIFKSVLYGAYSTLGFAEEAVAKLDKLDLETKSQEMERSSRDGRCHIVCVGGGAGAELVALAAAQRATLNPEAGSESAVPISITAVDMGDWSSVVSHLKGSITTPPPISKYASAAARATQAELSLLQDLSLCDIGFHHQDILDMNEAGLRSVILPAQEVSDARSTPGLITLMFTLNELFTASIPRTTRLLLTLTDILPSGWRLLVVDSPGSYSTVRIGNKTDEEGEAQQKQYPMKWLLDHTLLEVARKKSERGVDGAVWDKVVEEESIWSRLDENLKYPFELEDMRYQMHLYRRI